MDFFSDRIFLIKYFPSWVVGFAVVLMPDTTADHEAVLSVAVSLDLSHIWELAVLQRTGGRGDEELRCDLVPTVVTSGQ